MQRPVDVIRSATSVNAEILRQTGRPGCIRPGALADVIVCEGDTLKDVSLLSRPEETPSMIMQGGRLHRNALATTDVRAAPYPAIRLRPAPRGASASSLRR